MNLQIKRRIFAVILCLFISQFPPLLQGVALAQTVDIGFLGQESISFSTTELIAGTRVRVYARIHNFGDVDVTGRVAFRQGTIPLGSSQPISVRAGGAYEEVFVDFTVPEADFNVRAEIVDTDPSETVLDNNIVLSRLFEPIPDEDQDGIEDDVDNCPSSENEDQRDADADGLGDVCDDDDDNDVLSDEVEAEMGSDPESADSDGDGVVDGEDPQPTEVQETAETEVSDETNETQAQEMVIQEVVAAAEAEPEATTEADDVESVTLEDQDEAIVQETSFSTSQTAWNSYTFQVPENTPSNATVLWTFGDGSTSSKPAVEHTFREPGSYEVRLRITSLGETLFEETDSIGVSFFHFENPSVKLVMSILLVLLILGLSIVFRLRKLAEGRL